MISNNNTQTKCWVCSLAFGLLFTSVFATGCQSTGGGGYVGRQEFDTLVNRVDRLEATVGTIQGDLPSSVSRSRSGVAPTAQNTWSNDGGVPVPVFSSSKGSTPVVSQKSDQATYNQGQALLKQKRYNQAASVFQQFLAQNPRGSLAPNARYWLGECYYAQGLYSEAAREFQRCADDYPASAKAPDALLKLAYSYDRLGDASRAMVAADELLTKYPQAKAVNLLKKGPFKL